MERPFLLFEGWEYDSQGGMNEYAGAFPDLQAAVDFAERKQKDKYDWAHVAMWIDGELTVILERIKAWGSPPHQRFRQWYWRW